MKRTHQTAPPTPPSPPRPSLVNRLFRIGVTIKGLDGLLEGIGGLFLLLVPVTKLHGWIGLATYELSEGKHAFIASAVTRLDHLLTPGLALFGALYLLAHGGIKVALSVALLRRRYRVYPFAIAFLLLFIFYQSYRIGYDHSLPLAILTAFDSLVAWLTYLEWRRHGAPTRTALATDAAPVSAKHRPQQLMLFIALCVALGTTGIAMAVNWPQSTAKIPPYPSAPHQLRGQLGSESVTGTPAPALTGQQFVPIVLYHYPPPNLNQQLSYLVAHRYTTITLEQVGAAFKGIATLPSRPIVLTFDDGFANQMQAFALLQQYHMQATFYIINGGPASAWCIGAGRRYHDPLQPPQGCGDAYLTWDQVRQLDRSGLVTIGGHTLDHPNLTTLSPDQQRHEIADSKAGIEQQLGHPIHDFAYPYGDYNATTIQIVQTAGYTTAVTTKPGDYQNPASPYTLSRIRDTLSLP